MYNNLIDIYVEVEDVKKSVDGNTHIMYTVTAMNEEEVIDNLRFVRVRRVRCRDDHSAKRRYKVLYRDMEKVF